ILDAQVEERKEENYGTEDMCGMIKKLEPRVDGTLGLKINIHKSKLMGIGVSNEDVTIAANLIGCTTFTTPFNYLGFKVGAPNFKSCSWDEVLTKIFACLSKWKLKTLSIGGRLTLIKSVLTSLPLYHMSIYKVPMGVLNRMESIRRRFFIGADNNKRKISMIGWQKVLASKKKGGLEVSSFFALNQALLFKYIWRFISHGAGSRSSLWYNIIHETGSLSIIENNKQVTVAVKLSDGFVTDSFRRALHGGIEEKQLLLLVNNLESVILAESNDRWIWLLDSLDEFSVNSARSHIEVILLATVSSSTRWVNVVPIKINIFAWKISLDKLPTRLNLSLRGIEISSIICPICSSARESDECGMSVATIEVMGLGLLGGIGGVWGLKTPAEKFMRMRITKCAFNGVGVNDGWPWLGAGSVPKQKS
ncbi:RNA-directed DNA polymerase, eukaryota, reverse transcriptase zinc-binding domain protein, partial [Tanacetum coccineum]